VAWHVGTKRLAEGTADGLIRIWDVDQEKTTLILKGSAPWLNYWGGRWLAWSPDGMKLAAGFRDTTVRVWETRSGQELKVFRGLKAPVLSVAFSSDSARLAAWGADGTIKIWDTDTGRLSADVVHPNNTGAGAWSPDDKLLAAGHGDGTVTISGTQPGDKVVTLGGGFAPITDLAWSPDSRRLASASSYDYTTRIWEVSSKKMVLGPLLHSHEVMSVAWEPNGQRVATGSIDETVKIWDATTGRELVTLRGYFRAVTSLSWGPDGRLASGSDDGSVKVWNAIRDQESSILPGHAGRAHAVSWSPDGKRLASGGDDGKVRIWDAATRAEVRTLTGHDKERVNGQLGLIRSLAWSPDGNLLASAGLDGRSFVWEVATGKEVFTLPAGRGFVWSVAWSLDGTYLAAGSQDGTLRVIEGLKHTPKVHVFKAHPPRSDQFGGTRTLAWSPQGDRLASGGPDGLVKLWDPIRGTELAHMQGRQNLVFTVAWSQDGKRLASGSADLDVIVWDAQTGQKLATMRGHHSWVEGVAWSPDGTRLASAGGDNSVRVWDPTTGEETFVLRGNSGMFHDVSWHPDGAQLAAANDDGQIWIWDATRGFERDTTARALPYIDRKVASGTARGEDLLWYAQSYFRAGKPREAMALVKDKPSALLDVDGKLTADERKEFSQLRPDVAADWLRAQQSEPAPAASARARSLVQSGVAAFESGGRPAEAIRDLQEASGLLRTMRKDNPNDGQLSSDLGISLGFLGGALRDSHRSIEALAAFREARSVLESMPNPAAMDLYNLACGYAQLSVLLRHAATPPTASQRESLVDQAVDALRRAIAAGMKDFAQMDRDADLDPLRGRSDFRKLIQEAKAAHKIDAAPPAKTENDKKRNQPGTGSKQE
jgi:WD40 repeat protein